MSNIETLKTEILESPQTSLLERIVLTSILPLYEEKLALLREHAALFGKIQSHSKEIHESAAKVITAYNDDGSIEKTYPDDKTWNSLRPKSRHVCLYIPDDELPHWKSVNQLLSSVRTRINQAWRKLIYPEIISDIEKIIQTSKPFTDIETSLRQFGSSIEGVLDDFKTGTNCLGKTTVV